MKANQFAAVFASIKTRTNKEAPYRVGVLMLNGQTFAGTAQPVTAAGLVEMAVERVAEAHLSKAPEIVWLDVEHIQAITDNEFLATPAVVPLEGQAGETVQTEAHENTEHMRT